MLQNGPITGTAPSLCACVVIRRAKSPSVNSERHDRQSPLRSWPQRRSLSNQSSTRVARIMTLNSDNFGVSHVQHFA
jgi:hypothetical protein